MTKKKVKENLKFMQSASTAGNLSPITTTISSPTVQDATEQKPESSPNKTPQKTGEEPLGTNTNASGAPQAATPQISEEDRKALENLATAIGIPQIVQHMKEQDEKLNLLLGAKTGIPGVAPGGAAAGFLKPIMDKAPELIDGIMKWISGTGQSQQPTMISGIDKEIMETAIKTTTEARAKATQVADLLLKNMMQGGSVMVDQNGNAVILKPKIEEKKT